MRIVISSAAGDILSQEIIDTKGRRVTVHTTHKKNFLKENCAASAAPNVQDVTTMTPQAAYDAGRNDAINEIMEMISGMITGEVPIDIGVPADLVGIAQLQEKWKGDAEIEQTGEWSDMTVAQLKKRRKALMDKEERTKAEQEEVREINFAIRAKTGWKRGKGATK
tara:strand:- start:2717 stop:3214 length:498 start_codon:yes stop_codon:yes gene_type:complete